MIIRVTVATWLASKPGQVECNKMTDQETGTSISNPRTLDMQLLFEIMDAVWIFGESVATAC